MSKEVLLSIEAFRDGVEVNNILTRAKMKKNSDSYSFVFDCPTEIGNGQRMLDLKINDNSLVLSLKGAKGNSDIVLEKGVRHFCIFRGKEGSASIGIDTKTVSSDLNENGGTYEVEYYMDYNCANSSRNLMKVSVFPSNQR